MTHFGNMAKRIARRHGATPEEATTMSVDISFSHTASCPACYLGPILELVSCRPESIRRDQEQTVNPGGSDTPIGAIAVRLNLDRGAALEPVYSEIEGSGTRPRLPAGTRR